jgi:hypothetical protein
MAIFDQADLAEQNAKDELDARRRIAALQDRATAKQVPVYGVDAAKSGVPARRVEIGTETQDPELDPKEAQKQADLINKTLIDKKAASQKEFLVNNAQQETKAYLDALDRKDLMRDPNAPPTSQVLFNALGQGVQAAVPVMNQIRDRAFGDLPNGVPPGLPTSSAERLDQHMLTLVSHMVQQQSQQNGGTGISTVFAGQNMPPVQRMTPEQAAAAGLPSDPVLAARAAAGQPVYVGAGSNVARLDGPGQAPPATTVPPATVPPAGSNALVGPPRPSGDELPHPQAAHETIAEVAQAAMKHISKAIENPALATGMTASNPMNMFGGVPGGAASNPMNMYGGVGGAAPTAQPPVATAQNASRGAPKMDPKTFAQTYAAAHPGSTGDQIRQAYLVYVQQG